MKWDFEDSSGALMFTFWYIHTIELSFIITWRLYIVMEQKYNYTIMILPSCYQLTVSLHHIIAPVSKDANWLLFIYDKAFSLLLQRTQWSSSAFLVCHPPSRQSTTQRSLNIQIQLITKRRMGNSPFIFVHPVVDPSKKVWILENSLIFRCASIS